LRAMSFGTRKAEM